MRRIASILLAIMVFNFTVCEAQEKSSQKSTETQKKGPVPRMELHAAVVTNNLDVIRKHIEAGSDLNVSEPSRASSPLISAAFMGNTEAANLLIEAGANLNYKNADGSTALHTAAAFGKTEVAKLLILSGIDINIKNKEGSTALHTAAFFCHTDIVEVLLEKGVDKTIKNKSGKTALDVVETPFDNVKGIYDAVGAALKPLGLNLDYDHIKATRPIIAAMLR